MITGNKNKQLITILGSTGSIGVSTLNVVDLHPEEFGVYALTANTKVDEIFQQCLKYKPQFAVMVNPEAAKHLQQKLQAHAPEVKVLQGVEGLQTVSSAEQVDSVMAAIVGGAGLLPSLAAANAGKKVLLANKESLVMAGDLFMNAIKINNAQLLPIDSEHNAIFQCLPVNEKAFFEQSEQHGFEKIVLTASGGPFLKTPVEQMLDITPEQACAHPNWSMGPKISVDSATMLNKALELIEASFLFNVAADNIDILIHPQSIVHSMVHYCDGSVMAQLGNPDMCTPIAYGLAWPNRIEAGVKSLQLSQLADLEFIEPDEKRFPCLRLGRQAAIAQASAPIILNAANEEAVAAFLSRKLSFMQIPAIIEGVLNHQELVKVDSIDEVLNEDSKARITAKQLIDKLAI